MRPRDLLMLCAALCLLALAAGVLAVYDARPIVQDVTPWDDGRRP
jgi:hypothetical protein